MDLAKIDLGGAADSSAEGSELDNDSSPELVEVPLHNKTEDLHLYYKQTFAARVGKTGIFLILGFSISLLMTTAILIFSYTEAGKSFLGNLSIIIF